MPQFVDLLIPHRPPTWILCICLFAHISEVNERVIDTMSIEMNVTLTNMYSIQTNPSTMADKISTDHPANKFVNFFHEKYTVVSCKYAPPRA